MERAFLKKFNELRFSDLFCFCVLVFITLLIHAPALFPTHIINPDAQYIFPILENGFIEYLGKLVRYETLDFQPIRDLTLLLDLSLYRLTGRVFSVFINCFIWAGACLFIHKIIRETLSRRSFDLIIILSFAVYPIFGQAINWGIARKHLLAFFFTSWATYRLIRWTQTNKGEFFICLLYACSVLSLPVSVLWPVWAAISVKLLWPGKMPSFRKMGMLLALIMILVTFINWSYYKTSVVFLETYPQKEGRMDFILMLIAFGHYMKQILFPYQLAFSYTYGNGAVIGIGIFVLLLIWFLYFHRRNRTALVWVLFGIIHLAVLLSSPYIYFDTYLLMPALSMFLTGLTVLPKIPEKIIPILLIPILIWSGLSFASSRRWTDRIAFFGESFTHDPNCTNAVAYATALYLNEKKAPDGLFRYIQENTCTELRPGETASKSLKLMSFEALQLYVEDEIDLDYRLSRMKELGQKNYAPMLIYASLLARLDRKEEVEEATRFLNQYFTQNTQLIDYHPIYSKVLPSYCQQYQLAECRKLLKHLAPAKEDPFL